ncbi:MAG: hypothetical protein LBS36_00630 [Oscillospiraceae bacterium]|jgi:4-hydroxy-2-oxoheptanedioate aldolase|nr:hypothetical protein [Oscillospiraceae bacterium]
MNQQELKQAFLENRRVYGTLIASPSPKWAEHVAKIGVDFVFIDSEHMPLDPSARAWMCQCYKAMNIAPIVRIPYCNPYDAFFAIESGAVGIVSPYLETMDEVDALIGAVKYRPLKGKKLRDVLAGRVSLSEKESAYLRQYNNGNLLILNIESEFAVNNIDALLSRPEVDAVFIGPHDLSINMGIPDEYDNPLFERQIETVINACLRHKKGVANHYSGSLEKQLLWANKGMNVVLWNADSIRFTQALSEDFNKIKAELGETAAKKLKHLSI